MALFRDLAAGAAGRRTAGGRGQEGPPWRRGTAGAGGRDAEAGRGPVSRGCAERGVPTAAVIWPDRPAQPQVGRALGAERGACVRRRDQVTPGGNVAGAAGTGKMVMSWLLENC